MEILHEVHGIDQAIAERERPMEIPSGQPVGERARGDVAYEVVRPVLFNMPIFRFVRYALGAVLCTIILNSPWWSSGGSTLAKVEVRPIDSSVEIPGAASAMVTAKEEALRLDPKEPVVPQKAAAVITPSAAAKVVRTEKKRTARVTDALPQARDTGAAAEATPDTDVPHLVRSAKRIDAASLPVLKAPKEVMSSQQLGEQQANRDFWTQWLETLWQDAIELSHIILAAAVLIGFMVHLRSRIKDLFAGLSEFVSRVRPKMRT